MASFNSLPLELVSEITSHLPSSSYSSTRLASRALHSAVSTHPFNSLATFIDPETAVSNVRAAASSIEQRRRPIWSPNCSVPADLPIPKGFLLAMYVSLRGTSWPTPMKRKQLLPLQSTGTQLWEDDSSSGGYSSDEDALPVIPGLQDHFEEEEISIKAMGRVLNRSDLTEDTLRQALFRYALFLSYTHTGEEESPHLWVMSRRKWQQYEE